MEEEEEQKRQQTVEEEDEEEQKTDEPQIEASVILETERLMNLCDTIPESIPLRSLPRQDYLRKTVVPILLESLSLIIKERPEDPIESLAMYLVKNNPNTPELRAKLDISEFQ